VIIDDDDFPAWFHTVCALRFRCQLMPADDTRKVTTESRVRRAFSRVHDQRKQRCSRWHACSQTGQPRAVGEALGSAPPSRSRTNDALPDVEVEGELVRAWTQPDRSTSFFLL
jgi:hypothetical protein